IACRIQGAERQCEELERSLGPEDTPLPGSGVTWRRSPCLGQCERAPAILTIEAGETPASYSAQEGEGLLPQFGQPGLRLLNRIGRVDPESVDAYRADGGYSALERAIELRPEGVIRELIASNLVGRGGAAFPTGRKWEAVAKAAARPHYVVCNADESEPGTFKDRILMEG